MIAPRSEAAAAELLGVVDRGGQVVEGGAREGAREGQGHETRVLLRRPGLRGEEQLGAMQLDAWGKPMWKQDAGQWLNRRSEDAKVCVTDLIDHMTTESKQIYAGTDMEDCFLMFHDALAQRNEDEAQLYIKNRYPGFENRFKPVGTTCASTIYHDMVPGNSPKNARGLDSFGFADLEYAMCFNCALAWHYPYGDARRIFGQGTPKEVWNLMEQTWTALGVPINARVSRRTSQGGSGCAARSSMVPKRNGTTDAGVKKGLLVHLSGHNVPAPRASCASASPTLSPTPPPRLRGDSSVASLQSWGARRYSNQCSRLRRAWSAEF